MIKRIFGWIFGLGLGLFVGAWFVRRMDEASRAVAPTNLASQAGRLAGEISSRLRVAQDVARRSAAQREAELRAEFHVPRASDVLRTG